MPLSKGPRCARPRPRDGRGLRYAVNDSGWLLLGEVADFFQQMTWVEARIAVWSIAAEVTGFTPGRVLHLGFQLSTAEEAEENHFHDAKATAACPTRGWIS